MSLWQGGNLSHIRPHWNTDLYAGRFSQVRRLHLVLRDQVQNAQSLCNDYGKAYMRIYVGPLARVMISLPRERAFTLRFMHHPLSHLFV